MGDLPIGITVLHHDGDGPAPIGQTLAACEPETDPERRGAQVLLAVARRLWPNADLGELVGRVALLDARGAAMDPAMVASVAQAMGLVP